MTNDNFCILILVATIVFILYMMNKSDKEGFNANTQSAAEVVKNIVEAKNNATVSNDLVDKMATKFVEVIGKNVASLPTAETNTIDIFKTNQEQPVGVPEPISRQGRGAIPFDNNLDTTQLSNLGEHNKTMLTSDQLLPNDQTTNEHNMYKVDASYMDVNLAANGLEKIGVDTIGSSRKYASWDIRGVIPNPKFNVSPWMQSSVDPDNNLVGLNRNH